jgi:hypothetical protein
MARVPVHDLMHPQMPGENSAVKRGRCAYCCRRDRERLGRPREYSHSFGAEGADSGGMLRLMGLPHVARFPKATVAREEDCFQLLFRGEEHSRRVDVDLRYLEDADDLEATELRLLARLQELGYQVERRTSPSA